MTDIPALDLNALNWAGLKPSEFEALIAAARQLDAVTAERDDAYKYAKELCESFVSKYFPDNLGWCVLPDLIGVLTQIDNATTITASLTARNAALTALVREAVEGLAKIKAMRVNARYFDKKSEFFGGDASTYNQRKDTAIADLGKLGDMTEVVINEGDWGLLRFTPGLIDQIADTLIAKLNEAIK